MSSDSPEWRDGWSRCATRRFSPNADARALGSEITLVVLHHISLPAGQFGGDAVIDFFENRLDAARYAGTVETDSPAALASLVALVALAEVRVSAHFFVRRTGEIVQFVSGDDRAWHAGVSAWRGRSGCNDFSLGVEIEGDALTAFTDAQYAALDALLDALKANYPIKAVTTHSEIAPGRKIDPGPTFDWSRLGSRWHC